MATHYKTVTSSMSKHGRWTSTVNNFVLEFVLFRYTFFRKLKTSKFIWALGLGDCIFIGLHLTSKYFFFLTLLMDFMKIWISKRTSKINVFPGLERQRNFGSFHQSFLVLENMNFRKICYWLALQYKDSMQLLWKNKHNFLSQMLQSMNRQSNK